jgi:hypothetical protein
LVFARNLEMGNFVTQHHGLPHRAVRSALDRRKTTAAKKEYRKDSPAPLRQHSSQLRLVNTRRRSAGGMRCRTAPPHPHNPPLLSIRRVALPLIFKGTATHRSSLPPSTCSLVRVSPLRRGSLAMHHAARCCR